MHPGGRNALVTGVSRRAGIGYAIARRLMDAGAAVFVQGWTEHDAAQPWGSEPGGTETVAGELDAPFAEVDFADPAAPEQLVAAATEALGPLDILVVNHARSGDGRLADLSAGEIDAFLAENVRAALLLVREFAARHDDSRPGGRVVLMTSGQHLAPMTSEVAYAVSKGALQQADPDPRGGARRPRDHGQHGQPWAHGHRLGTRRPRPHAAHAVRAVGAAG